MGDGISYGPLGGKKKRENEKKATEGSHIKKRTSLVGVRDRDRREKKKGTVFRQWSPRWRKRGVGGE